MQSHVLVCL